MEPETVTPQDARATVAGAVAKTQRDMAVDAAEQAALDRHVAEQLAAQERLTAVQHEAAAHRAATERMIVASQLQSARVETSNLAFGKWLMIGIIFAAGVVFALLMYFHNQPAANVSFAAPPPPGNITVR